MPTTTSHTPWKSLLAASSLLITAAGCGDATTPAAAPPSCVPDRAQWDATVHAIVERSCGSCHGATPAYGAPYSLLDYSFITTARTGGRPVDRMHVRLADGSMPPAGTPAPTFADAQTIASWASCGATTLTDDTRLRSTAPLFRPPAEPPADTTAIELRADNYAVQQVSDRYQCFTFSNVVQADQFIRRFDVLLDHTEVLHHVVLYKSTGTAALDHTYECAGSPADSVYTYTWAPGEDALQFPDGGMRIRPGDRYILQIHYNNSRGLTGITDHSGVRLSVGAPTGTEYGMVAIGPAGFSIPARSTQSVAAACTLAPGTRVLASMPHMHQIGSAYDQVLVHGTTRTPIISLTNWQFQSQYFYSLPLTIAAGDRIETTCTYNNTTSNTVRSGTSTTDEMCFGFTYVTPPPSAEYCSEPIDPTTTTGLTYAPGMCSPPGASADVALVTGGLRLDAAPAALAGGDIPDAHWVVSGVEYIVNMLATPIGALDATTSSIQARGQLWTTAGHVTADLVGSLSLAFTAGNTLAHAIPQINFSSSYVATGGTLALTSTCTVGTAATTPASVQYEVRGDDLLVGLSPQGLGSLSITPRYTFHRMR